MIELRPYQHEGIAACPQAMRAARRVLYAAPAGSGKTIIAAIAASVATKGKRAIILVHRRELVRQTAAKLEGFGIGCGYRRGQACRPRPADQRRRGADPVRPSLAGARVRRGRDRRGPPCRRRHLGQGAGAAASRPHPGRHGHPERLDGCGLRTCSTRWCQAARSQKRWGRIALTASCSAWRAPAHAHPRIIAQARGYKRGWIWHTARELGLL